MNTTPPQNVTTVTVSRDVFDMLTKATYHAATESQLKAVCARIANDETEARAFLFDADKWFEALGRALKLKGSPVNLPDDLLSDLRTAAIAGVRFKMSESLKEKTVESQNSDIKLASHWLTAISQVFESN